MNELEPCQQTLQISTHNSQKQKSYSVLKIISRSGKKKLVPYADVVHMMWTSDLLVTYSSVSEVLMYPYS